MSHENTFPQADAKERHRKKQVTQWQQHKNTRKKNDITTTDTPGERQMVRELIRQLETGEERQE